MPTPELRQILADHFDIEELRTLCYDLGVRYDNLRGEGNAAKARELVSYFERRGRITELIEKVRKERPDIPWDIADATELEASENKFKKVWEAPTGLSPIHLFAGSECLYLISDGELSLFSVKHGRPLQPPLTALGDDAFSLTDCTVTRGLAASSDTLLLTLVSNDSGKYCLLTLKCPCQEGASLELLWHYEARGTQLSPPLLHGEIVYHIQRTDSGHELLALDYKSGEEQNAVPFQLSGSDNPYLDCVSLAVASDTLCLTLCDGKILHLDHETGQTKVLRTGEIGFRSSPVATDGRNLFFRTYPTQNPTSSGRLYAWNVASREVVWQTEMVPDFNGKRKPMAGRPLVINDVVCVACGRDLVCAFDLNTGQELWRYTMPDRVEVAPVWAGETVVMADRSGNMHALQFGRPRFEVRYTYDPETPPTYKAWNPLVFTVLNTGYRTAHYTTLRIRSDDFRGVSEHHTQELLTIMPGEHTSCEVKLLPETRGKTVYVPVTIDYQDDDEQVCSEKSDLFIPVLESSSPAHPQPVQPDLDLPGAYPIISQSVSVQAASKLGKSSNAVGKLVVPKYRNGKHIGEETGTAWFIAPGLALTCWHVIETKRYPGEEWAKTDLEKQINNARLILDFTELAKGRPYAIKLEHANKDKDTLDYAILCVENWDEHCDYLGVDARAPLTTSTRVCVVHHPLGQPQHLAWGECYEAQPDVVERVWYALDTDPGSSGGPVFDTSSSKVVAMHSRNQGTFKEGIKLRPLLDDLSASGLTELYQQIKKAQEEKGGRV